MIKQTEPQSTDSRSASTPRRVLIAGGAICLWRIGWSFTAPKFALASCVLGK